MIRQWIAVKWYELKDTLWFVPAAMTAAAIVFALALVRVDQALLLDRRAGSAWLFGGGVDGARGVLESIAGTMVTVTGVVFSITIVALQLASSQFTPRVLRTFTGDRGNQLVLGAFISTFTYALLVLRSVRSAGQNGTIFVPSLSVTVAIVLSLASIAFLIYYLHHAARSIQASVVIDHAASDTLQQIDTFFPADRQPDNAIIDWRFVGLPLVLHTERSGYVQYLNVDTLFDLATCAALTMRVEPAVGDFLLPGTTLALVWRDKPVEVNSDDDHDADQTLAEQVRNAFVLGSERTIGQDIDLGFRQIADIALKALSPGINDPTTATICIERLAEALVTLANRNPAATVRRDDKGIVRLVVPGPSFQRLVATAFSQIRHYGAADATVSEHLASTLGKMAALVSPGHRPPLAEQARLLVEEAHLAIKTESDFNQVRAAADWTSRVMESRP